MIPSEQMLEEKIRKIRHAQHNLNVTAASDRDVFKTVTSGANTDDCLKAIRGVRNEYRLFDACALITLQSCREFWGVRYRIERINDDTGEWEERHTTPLNGDWFPWLQKNQGQSAQWATTHGGWRVIEIIWNGTEKVVKL